MVETLFVLTPAAHAKITAMFAAPLPVERTGNRSDRAILGAMNS
jgi:hypothetical protein